MMHLKKKLVFFLTSFFVESTFDGALEKKLILIFMCVCVCVCVCMLSLEIFLR
jgi:hypothetical protein